MALTKKKIDAARYEGDGTSWDVRPDGTIPGLWLRLYPSGAKSFVLRYRHGGRVRYYVLGRYGVLTLEQARKKARRLLGQVADGLDPLSEKRRKAEEARRKEAEGVTVAEFADRWLEDYAKAHRRTWPEDKRRIETRIKPALGRLALASVTSGDVAKLHAEIGRTAKVEANRVAQLLRALYNAALAWGVLPTGHANPAAVSRSPYLGGNSNVRTFRERSRERYVRPDEMPALLEAIEREENAEGRAVLKLLLLTGCRKREILGARWEDVDLKRGELRLPEAKEGGRTVRLPADAVEILKGLPRGSSRYLFPSRFDPEKPRRDIKRSWDRVREAAGLEDVTVHDLRRTVGAWLASSGTSELVIQDVLGQTSAEAVRIYARIADESARDAIEGHAAALRRSRLSVS